MLETAFTAPGGSLGSSSASLLVSVDAVAADDSPTQLKRGAHADSRKRSGSPRLRCHRPGPGRRPALSFRSNKPFFAPDLRLEVPSPPARFEPFAALGGASSGALRLPMTGSWHESPPSATRTGVSATSSPPPPRSRCSASRGASASCCSFAEPASHAVTEQGSDPFERVRPFLRGLAMRMRGLEPPRAFAHTDLNRARLPIPPHPRGRTV
jgi:hypothetical protein